MIYIQSNKEKTLPHHFDCACALYGALDSAMDYRLTTFEEVAAGKFNALIKNNLFVGSVEFMREVFKNVGKCLDSLRNSFTPYLNPATSKSLTAKGTFIICKAPAETSLKFGFKYLDPGEKGVPSAADSALV